MCQIKLPAAGKASLTIDKELWDRYKQAFIEHKEYWRSRGITSPTELAVKVLSEGLDQILPKPRFRHINTYDDQVKLEDRELPPQGRIVTVYFKKGYPPWCEYCESFECIHTDYVWTIPQVEEKLRDSGVVKKEKTPPWG